MGLIGQTVRPPQDGAAERQGAGFKGPMIDESSPSNADLHRDGGMEER